MQRTPPPQRTVTDPLNEIDPANIIDPNQRSSRLPLTSTHPQHASLTHLLLGNIGEEPRGSRRDQMRSPTPPTTPGLSGGRPIRSPTSPGGIVSCSPSSAGGRSESSWEGFADSPEEHPQRRERSGSPMNIDPPHTPTPSRQPGPPNNPRGVPKKRTTARLDLLQSPPADLKPLKDLLEMLRSKNKIVVIAGAGISTSARIPNFRSRSGLFQNLGKDHKGISAGKDLFDASVYQTEESVSLFHDTVRYLSELTRKARPTNFHLLLAKLAKEGRLLRLYTQNIDGIDVALEGLNTQVPLPEKDPWPKTIQLHGGFDKMVCSKCHGISPLQAEKFIGPEPPACPTCLENDRGRKEAGKRSHGIGTLRPRMVLYNQHNPDGEAIGSCVSAGLRRRPDAVIVVGTALSVPAVRRTTQDMCATVRDRRNGMNIWINIDSEPRQQLANLLDFVVKGPCDKVAQLALQTWD
ncbi:DHS-like NAD/FAD-binding domain-containing protein [Trematosphaeria pertusa]|uniref:DHS-like NAD/FAD-binding domain-containing protein n=1 Tax=Trematosphaeria pertusa TaxID=390896 RepID=A0A6A6HU70_9PLEO|nr:DHS-like NAD/FAD-binding domain-containing protein [Trematosphaeria pertusa]KAF2241332.1 DHS-like NAD/FAD-binding domain-containing protein [Trematosphaeria pertusa]